MKKNIRYTLLVIFQAIGIPLQVLAMENLRSESLGNINPLTSREQRLSSTLSQILDIKADINGDEVILKGDRGQLAAAIGKLNNFDQLRQNIIPASSNTIFTQECDASHFACWNDCLISLGIPPVELSNFSITNQLDQNSCLRIPYGPITAEPTFNQRLADIYIDEIKKRSPYFNWVSQNSKELIQLSSDYDYLLINYGLLTDYFCKLEAAYDLTSQENVFTSKFSLKTILKRLTAAAGGDVSLVPTPNFGQYKVRTVMLGDNQLSYEGAKLVIEILIDKSGSMDGEKITEVNKRMPKILEQFREALNEGESLKVDIYAFNDQMSFYKNYMLEPSNQLPIVWSPLYASGGTDLTTVGERMQLSSPSERKVVVAFTDGEHEASSDINASLKKLKNLQHEGKFAQPYFCRVGVKSSKNSTYFTQISEIFAGSYQDHNNIDEFCKVVSSNIPYLLESNSPLVITLNGIDITIRQQDAKPDIHVTSEHVQEGDAIMHKGIRYLVPSQPNLSPISIIKEETVEEKRKRLQAQMDKLKEELDKLNM